MLWLLQQKMHRLNKDDLVYKPSKILITLE
jgi:hypothetical protein